MPRRILACATLLALLMLSMAGNGCQQAMIELDTHPVVVRRELTSDPKTIDPHKAGDVVSSAQSGMAYEQLYEYEYLVQPAKVKPGLAAALPTISEDGLTYTIPLKRGVFFQDNRCFPDGKGREFTADDVVYSIKRMAALPDTTGFWVAEDKIEGLDAFRTYALSVMAATDGAEAKAAKLRQILARDVPGVQKVDSHTVRIQLVKRYPQFVYTQCMSYFAIVPREAVDYYGDDLFRNPVGTGPFRLVHWDYGREILWERNPRYAERGETFPELPANDIIVGETKIDPEEFRPWVGKALPLADRISFRIIKESQASWLEYLAGHIDVFAPESDQFSAAIQNDDLTPEMIEKGIKLDMYERAVVEYFTFNFDDAELGTAGGAPARAIRKAFSCAINREDYIKTYINGRGVPATMLVPRLFPEFDPEYVYAHSQHDPARGRQILEEAGFTLRQLDSSGNNWQAIDPRTGQPARVTMLLRGTTSTATNMATFLGTSGRKVGLEVNAIPMEFQEFLKRQYGGTGQSYNAGWVMDYPDAENIMGLLYSKQAVNDGLNSARYRNPRYDALYLEMTQLDSTIPEQLERKRQLIREAHDVIAEDCPWVLLYFQKQYRLNQNWSLQAIPNDFSYGLFKYAASDSAARTKLAGQWRHTPVLPGVLVGLLFVTMTSLFFWKVVRGN